MDVYLIQRDIFAGVVIEVSSGHYSQNGVIEIQVRNDLVFRTGEEYFSVVKLVVVGNGHGCDSGLENVAVIVAVAIAADIAGLDGVAPIEVELGERLVAVLA